MSRLDLIGTSRHLCTLWSSRSSAPLALNPQLPCPFLPGGRMVLPAHLAHTHRLLPAQFEGIAVGPTWLWQPLPLCHTLLVIGGDKDS